MGHESLRLRGTLADQAGLDRLNAGRTAEVAVTNKLTKVIGKAEAQLDTVFAWSAGHCLEAKNCRTR